MSGIRAAMLAVLACLAALAVLSAGCRPEPSPVPPRSSAGESTATRGPAMPTGALKDVLERHTPGLLAVTGVVGTGEGLEGGVPVFVIFVVKNTPELAARLPREVERYPVVIRETGEVRAYSR